MYTYIHMCTCKGQANGLSSLPAQVRRDQEPALYVCLICLPYIGDVNGLASDAVASPPELEALHSERLLYLPDTMYVHLLEYDVIVPS